MQEEIEAIKKLVEQNQRDLAALTKKVDWIRHKMMWASVYGFFKFLLIVVPLVLGIIYLQPYINRLLQSWTTVQQRLDELNNPSASSSQSDAIFEQLKQKYLNQNTN